VTKMRVLNAKMRVLNARARELLRCALAWSQAQQGASPALTILSPPFKHTADPHLPFPFIAHELNTKLQVHAHARKLSQAHTQTST
jgi:hypothetical protein